MGRIIPYIMEKMFETTNQKVKFDTNFFTAENDVFPLAEQYVHKKCCILIIFGHLATRRMLLFSSKNAIVPTRDASLLDLQRHLLVNWEITT